MEKADGDRKETKAEKAERRQREAAAYDPKRFARRFKRRRRINWIGSIVSSPLLSTELQHAGACASGPSLER